MSFLHKFFGSFTREEQQDLNDTIEAMLRTENRRLREELYYATREDVALTAERNLRGSRITVEQANRLHRIIDDATTGEGERLWRFLDD